MSCSNEPAHPQSPSPLEEPEKSLDQVLDAFTQALDTLAEQLPDVKKYDLGHPLQAQRTGSNVQSSSSVAYDAVLSTA